MRHLWIILALWAAPASAWVLEGKDLNGAALSLPTALSGRAGVLIVGLSQASSKATQAWEQRLWADLGSNTQVAVFGVAQLEGAPGFVVPMIIRGIKKSKDKAHWAQMLVLRSGRAALEALVSYDRSAPDDAYIVVLAPDASIRLIVHAPDLGPLDKVMKALASTSASLAPNDGAALE
jgi:hypothetical protein